VSDTVEDYKSMKAQAAEDRRLRRELAQRVLETDSTISFSSHNQGAHLIVVGVAASADFWPGTGRWAPRGGGSKKSWFGIEQMLNYVKTGSFKK